MEAGRRKKALVLSMILLIASSLALQGEAGGGGHGRNHGRVVAESIPAVMPEGKGPGLSNCTHNPTQPKAGPCPPAV
ncbi:hypothetical protein HU200_059947 [Digitaria exilis]|uniref:Uncharacterized protein n=1 Tax=Digitaria exilis TaxID=1010633 RepID=A0A835A7J6_9POAL|nr:hypothetical protein HU200_059947 [Digitaria exilis]